MITNYKLFEEKTLQDKWDRVNDYLRIIRVGIDNDSEQDFINIDPLNDESPYQDIQQFIIYTYGESNKDAYLKKIIELLLKYDLYIEDYPSKDELIISYLYSSTEINISNKHFIESVEEYFPGEYRKIKNTFLANKYKI